MENPPIAQKRAFDWLCAVLVLFGVLCLGVSVPATVDMARVTHDEYGAYLLVFVLEVMALFSLLAPIWVPSWEEEFSRTALVLLSATTLGNFAAGWNYIWSQTEYGAFWLWVRDANVFGFHLPAILLVLALSASVPFGMKFFIGLAVKRYRENELEHSPEAVAQRMVEPFQVQVLAVQRMQEQLLGLTEQFTTPLVLPADTRRLPVPPIPRQPTELPPEQPIPPSADVCSCGNPLTLSDRAVCGRDKWLRLLQGQVICKECREKQR